MITSPSTSSSSKPIGSTPRGSGIDYTELPQRYHRLPLTEEEIEFITVCEHYLILHLVWKFSHGNEFWKRQNISASCQRMFLGQSYG